ncbi:MAG: acetyl-CoA carboxylase biotin carboxyl carrier protein [Gammaproteobacteria bacterium]|nr:acetyl-CoA carboxylase biotin carboxyl carrier protein [Gammaproteobacteria bacterium]
MDIRKVKKLIELLEESGIAEIEITEGDDSVRISRYPTSGYAAAPQPVAVQTPAIAASVDAPAAQAAAPVAAPVAAPESGTPRGHAITAPMVGTMYTSPSPTADVFVNVGDSVAVGDIVCIIEAMKMMNQIEADVAGTVLAIEAQNGDPVEFGQTLIVVG